MLRLSTLWDVTRMQFSPKWTGVSMFASGGIGDLALRANGVEVLVASELLPDRASVLEHNFPEIDVIVGDIGRTMDDFIARAKARLGGRGLDILFATPPCQGMSRNGRGKLLQRMKDGGRVLLDERNQLVLQALTAARELSPRLVVFENVPEMANTLIHDREGKVRPIMEVVVEELGEAYEGAWEVVEFADYGVPQRRRRLISVFTTDPALQAQLRRDGTLLPPPSHSADGGDGLLPWVSVTEALVEVPPLDAGTSASATSEIPYHRVPLLDEDKYFWVSNTPVGKGAFDNQCVAPGCGHAGNATHGSMRDENGINRSRDTTPLHCERCGELLPRPWVREPGGGVRLMKGYASAYKRMSGDLPASALTRNLSYACSDHKLHPTEHRVLSLHEAFLLHTVTDHAYEWRRADGRRLADKTVREIIGESIPPRGLRRIFESLTARLGPPRGRAVA